jgi:hypothetical protein
MNGANPIGRTAVVLATSSLLATGSLYLLLLVPLLVTGRVANAATFPLVLGALAAILAVTLARIALVHRLAPHEQAFLRFWVHAPYFTFLFACTLAAVPMLLAFAAGPALGWSPSTLGWVLRAIALVVLVLSVLFLLVLWRRHQASLQASGPSAGARAA